MAVRERAKRFANWPHKPQIAPVRLDPLGHAIERYIERWHPAMGWLEAEGALDNALRTAHFVEDDPKTERTLWRTTEGCLLVVDREGTVRSVLPRNACLRRVRRGLR